MKQKTKRKLPLRAHLSLAFIIFSVILLIVLWLFQTVFLEETYKLIKTNQVKSCSHSIATNINDEDRTSLISDIQTQNDMKVTIYDTSSAIWSVIYSPENTGFFGLTDPSDLISYSGANSLYKEAENAGGEITKIVEPSNKFDKPDKPNNPNFDATIETDDFPKDRPPLERQNKQSVLHALIKEAVNTSYFIIVQSEITPVASVVSTLRLQLILITVIMIIISIIVAVITAKNISRPITKTNEKAKELAKQNYNIVFEQSKLREVDELNDTLNYATYELSKVDTFRKELIANISHDLRTPLTTITGYAEIMRDIPGENSPENIQVIIDESNRLKALVTDLLDISQLEAGALTIQKNIFNITQCIKDIFSRYTKLKEQENLNIIFDYTEDVFVEADELKITQVIYNLINNAINYIGEDNTIVIKQSIEINFVRIDVIDHGEGIEEDKLQYIWDRYYKVDKEHKRAKIGTGLGLSIVKNILLAHNANFGVNSKLGEGSDFYFSLPISNNN